MVETDTPDEQGRYPFMLTPVQAQYLVELLPDGCPPAGHTSPSEIAHYGMCQEIEHVLRTSY